MEMGVRCQYSSREALALYLTASLQSLTGAAKRPLTVEECRRFAVKNTVSLAWRIGRAVDFARKQHAIGQVGQVIIDAVGGADTAKLLFAGKIVEVSRR